MPAKFQLKFIDVMVGVVLGLGFNWWPQIQEPWQFIAFFFAYLTAIDYWIDYNPVAKKYPLRIQLDVILHTMIIFGMFLLIFAPQKTLSYFLFSFAFYRLADIIWIWVIKKEHRVPKEDLIFMNTWTVQDTVEMLAAVILATIAVQENQSPVLLLLIFIAIRALTRFVSSARYKRVFFAL